MIINNQPVLVSFLTAITVFMLFFSLLLPILSLLKNFIRSKLVKTGEVSIKVSFVLLFLAIVSSSFLIVAQDPNNIIGAILNGIGLTIGLIIFFVITLLQIRMVKGKGAIRRFLGLRGRDR